MKKLLLSALAVCAFTFGNAQEEKTTEAPYLAKGDIMVSGTVGFGSESTDDVKTNEFDFSPSASYFVSDNIGVGMRVGFGAGKGENVYNEVADADVEEAKTSTLKLGAFGRYLFTPSSKFSLFGELGFDYVTTKAEYTDGGATTEAPDYNGFDVNIGPGICYFVSDHFAIEANWGALGYTTRKLDVDNAEATNTFGLNVDLSDINFGLAYKF